MGKLINIFLCAGLMGLIFKIASIPLGRFFLTIGLGGLSIILIIQLVIILFTKNITGYFKLIISSSYLILSMCFISIMCKYQWWDIGILIPIISSWSYIILTVLIIVEKIYLVIQSNNKILFDWIIPAWIIIFILGIIPLILTPNQFYNIFHTKNNLIKIESSI